MKKIILFLMLFSAFFACKSVENVVTETTLPTEETTTTTIVDSQTAITDVENEEDNKIDFDFLSFNISYDEAESVEAGNSLYQIMYRLELEFINGKNNFTVDYEILDSDNKQLFAKSDIKPTKDKDEVHLFVVRDEFTNLFNIDLFRYHVVVHLPDKDDEYVGEFAIDNGVKIESLECGPIITQYENDSLITYLTIKSTLNMSGLLQWIRLIPPSEDYFWEIPFEKEGYTINAYAVLSDTKHKRYIDNGNYIFQVNIGRLGVLQKEIKIVDFFNNSNGANYGLPVATEIENDKNKIVLDLNFQEKVDKMEIHLFAELEGNLQKIAIASPLTVSTTLQKKDLSKLFVDDFGNKIKIKNNKKYFYQINLYSKEFNNLTYISVSEMIPIVFQGFSLW